MRPHVLVVDNYDSFTYNLVQYLEELGATVTVRLADRTTVAQVTAFAPDGIVVSPGPRTPREAGISVPLVQQLTGVIPILGVCLGHQAIGAAFGVAVVRARRVMHGKTSLVRHDGCGLFAGVPSPLVVMRYHSLVLDPTRLPPSLIVSATTDDGEVMGVRHVAAPVEGVQFHPESILTETGRALLANFLHALPVPRLASGAV